MTTINELHGTESQEQRQSSRKTEADEQRQLLQWCRTDPRLQYLFHIPNESVGGQGWIIRNRQLGVKAGVPDLFYPVPLGGYHGLFIEMKTRTGRLAPAQKRWFEALQAFGYKCVVAYGWEEAKIALEEYLDGTDDTIRSTGDRDPDR